MILVRVCGEIVVVVLVSVVNLVLKVIVVVDIEKMVKIGEEVVN